MANNFWLNFTSLFLLLMTSIHISSGRILEPNNNKVSPKDKCKIPITSSKLVDIFHDIERRVEYCDLVDIFDNVIAQKVNITRVQREVGASVMTDISCDACKLTLTLLQHFLRANKTDEEIIKGVTNICIYRHISTARVCEGIINLMGIELLQVLKQLSQQTPFQICGFLVGETCPEVSNPYHNWEVKLPERFLAQEPAAPDRSSPIIKVLQITDMHWDPNYAEGSNAACDEPLCCRWSNGEPEIPKDAAGKWGDYRKCDTPMITIDNMLEHIKNTHKDIDYIIWTGDLPAHDVWNYTQEESLRILRISVDKMINAFPNTPIYPSLGNHESVPTDSYPTDKSMTLKNVSWLYDEIEKQWLRFLPAKAGPTIKRGGFYSVLARPGLRIIAINNNYCSNKNWWLLLDSTDPLGQLQWLIDELSQAEAFGEKVHILGHIPPGNPDCVKIWSQNFYKVISRFSSTVVAQFYGHTHYDEFEVFYDEGDIDRPVAVAYVGPSVSAYFDLNSAYRIYHVDGDHLSSTRMVMDHETWIMDLDKANYENMTQWYKSYNALEAYNMTSLTPQAWDSLIYRMLDDRQLFDEYYKNYYSEAAVRPICDEDCRLRLLCDARSGRSHNRKEFCRDFIFPEESSQPIFDFI